MEIVLGVVIIGIAVYFYFKSQKKVNHQVKETKQKDETEITLEYLLKVNLDARNSSLDTDILKSLEDVIDEIKSITIEVNKPENFSELTVTTNRMATRYIPKILYPFIILSESNRDAKKDTFLDKLNVIKKQLIEIRTQLESKDTKDFEKMSRFIDGMFPDESAGREV